MSLTLNIHIIPTPAREQILLTLAYDPTARLLGHTSQSHHELCLLEGLIKESCSGDRELGYPYQKPPSVDVCIQPKVPTTIGPHNRSSILSLHVTGNVRTPRCIKSIHSSCRSGTSFTGAFSRQTIERGVAISSHIDSSFGIAYRIKQCGHASCSASTNS